MSSTRADAVTRGELPDEAVSPSAAPGRSGPARTVLLGVVFVCAACGLVYELALVTLGSYLLGNTAAQASIVLGVMVFAMGVGSLLAKRLRRSPVVSFVVIELVLALVGGLSVLGLYLAFAFLAIYTPALVIAAFAVGLLIGAEMPLLMELLQRIRKQAAGEAVADLFAADYIGALLGGLAFPFLLLPMLGQINGAIVVGLVNALAASIIVFALYARSMTPRQRGVLSAATAAVVAVLVAALLLSSRFEASARQSLYRDPIVYSAQTPYQEIVVTESVDGSDLRLFLNGDLQFSSTDEYRYHESLVHPALAGDRDEVLVLGGGDGLAVREILRYPDVQGVTVVDLDPAVTDLASTMPELLKLNFDSLNDERVEVINADAFSWLREHSEQYDVIIVDLPDPDQTAITKLYSVEFYGIVKAHLAPGGRMAVQGGSPYFAPKSYWCISASLQAAGLSTTPYHVDVPSFGDWGFFLATAEGTPPLTLQAPSPLKFLTHDLLQAASVFPADRGPRQMPASTLMDPVILEYAQAEWRFY